MTLRAHIPGRLAINRYLTLDVADPPYGPGSVVRHVVGSDQGNGYEWRAPGRTIGRGVVALELDGDRMVGRLTAVWDGSMLETPALTSLVDRAVDA